VSRDDDGLAEFRRYDKLAADYPAFVKLASIRNGCAFTFTA